MTKLVLRKGGDRRLRTGHLWVYRSEIADVDRDLRPGDAVDVLDAASHFLGRGFYNPRPSLACRLLTRRDEPVDAPFFLRRLQGAFGYRRAAGLVSDAYRLCWSEADGLPGLVVDRYGPVSVLQCLTLGMSRAVPWITEALTRIFPGSGVYRLDDLTAARIEGFEPQRGWVTAPEEPGPALSLSPAGPGSGRDAGSPGPGPPGEILGAPAELEIREGTCRFTVTFGSGHKTGLYLDQRENRVLAAAHASGRRMLDAFCYGGAFACHALSTGAASALLVESSADSLALARRNLALNGLEDRAALRQGNAFDVLRELESARERFGLVILDPPPFTRRKDAVEAAARGYKEINLRALRLLESGGVLATFSCSHHVTPALFEAICRDAAGDAGVDVRVLSVLSQSRDHPVLLTVPETRYLTGLLLEAV